MTDPSKPSLDVDALARRLPRPEPRPESAAALRHAMLEAAQTDASARPRSHRAAWIITTTAAAAAAVSAWLVLQPPRSPGAIATAPGSASALPGAVVAAGASSALPGASARPDAALSVPSRPPAPSGATPQPSGAVATTLGPAAAPLAEGISRFDGAGPVHITRGEATITAPQGARFEVDVRGDQIRRITVTAGWVVVASASAHTPATIITERQTWTPPEVISPALPRRPAAASPATAEPPRPARTATAEPPAPRTPTPPEFASLAGPAAARLATGTGATTDTVATTGATARATENEVTAPRPARDASPPVPPPAAPPSNERDFRDGLRALLAGDPRAAIGPLDHACRAPSSSEDDICYWAAVARLRTGDREAARSGFADMLGRWPASTHAGEASVALGWLLLQQGDRAGARTRFAAAADDRMASVRAEAIRGLAAAQ